MTKQPRYLAFLFIVVLAAAQTASSDPVAYPVEADPNDPAYQALYPPTTTTTTTTTTTLPSISMCPDNSDNDFGIHSSEGVYEGHEYWAYGFGFPAGTGGQIYCVENPYVGTTPTSISEFVKVFMVDTDWDTLMTTVIDYHGDSDACFICVLNRIEGCFPPGVKITMADGSLRNIEDVRAGDMVRNAKTGNPVKVRQVIEGPEALPLIRFGFDGTTVTTSQAHPVLTATGMKPASQVKKGDTVFDGGGKPHPVTIVETLPIEEGQRVINVNLDATSSDANDRLLVSDGIITGDIVLQGLLKERN